MEFIINPKTNDINGNKLVPKIGAIRLHHSVCNNLKVTRGDVVKVYSKDKERERIFREVWMGSNFGKESLFIDYDSALNLGVKNYNEIIDLNVTKTIKLCLYWNHPEHSIRVSCRLGMLSLVLGLISLIPYIVVLIRKMLLKI
jgi:hypothetical protein